MIFKKNNPGCPCCNCPCSCYKFDGDATDSVGSRDLTETNAAYNAGKLDNAATMAGSTYFKGDDHTCYEIGTDGLAVWFWFKADTACTTAAVAHFEGIVTKSIVDITAGLGAIAMTGEWGVYWHNSASPAGHADYAGNLYFVAKPTDNAGGGVQYISIPNALNDWADFIRTSDGWKFYYFWMSTDENKMYVRVNDGTTLEKAVPAGESFTPSSDQDMYVGNNLGKAVLGSQAVGAVANRTFHIDNLGFCGKVGTKAEMEARSTELYNAGAGLACNKAGL